MNQLIPFEQRIVGNETIETVNARDLHTELEVKKDFSQWVKSQIKRAHLVENEDYIVFAQKGENLQGGRPSQEYFLVLDAAKHVAMLSGTEKGREIRAYFITCEKRLRENKPSVPQVKDLKLQMMIEACIRMDAMEQEIVRQREEIIVTQQRTIVALEQSVEALSASQRAESKADMAIDESRRHTLEEFILLNGLLRQFPRHEFRAYAAWLKAFCLEHGLRMEKVDVYGQSWEHELAYPLPALAAWLRHEQRKPQQITLAQQHDEPTSAP